MAALRAATITDQVLSAEGAGYTAKVIFTPLSNPQVTGGTVLTSRPITVTTATNGTFSVTLKQGDYRVIVDGRDRLIISVPNNGSTYNLANLTTANTTYVYPTLPATASTFAGLADTLDLATATDGQVVVFDAGTQKWKPGLATGGGALPAGNNFELQYKASGLLLGGSTGWLFNTSNASIKSPVEKGLLFQSQDANAPGGILIKPYTVNGVRDDMLLIGNNVDPTADLGTVFGKGDITLAGWRQLIERRLKTNQGYEQSEFNLDWSPPNDNGALMKRIIQIFPQHTNRVVDIWVAGSTFSFMPNYYPYTNTTHFLNLDTGQVGFNMLQGGGIGIDPATRVHIFDTNAENQQLILEQDANYHVGIGFTPGAGIAGNSNAFGIYGGKNNYLSGQTNAVAMYLGKGVPRYLLRWSSGGMNDGAGTNFFDFAPTGAVFAASLTVPALAYDPTTWNGNLTVPTRDDLRDKLEALPADFVTLATTQTVTGPKLFTLTRHTEATGVVSTNFTIDIGQNFHYRTISATSTQSWSGTPSVGHHEYSVVISNSSPTTAFDWVFPPAKSRLDDEAVVTSISVPPLKSVKGRFEWENGEWYVAFDGKVRQSFANIKLNQAAGRPLVLDLQSNAVAMSGLADSAHVLLADGTSGKAGDATIDSLSFPKIAAGQNDNALTNSPINPRSWRSLASYSKAQTYNLDMAQHGSHAHQMTNATTITPINVSGFTNLDEKFTCIFWSESGSSNTLAFNWRTNDVGWLSGFGPIMPPAPGRLIVEIWLNSVNGELIGDWRAPAARMNDRAVVNPTANDDSTLGYLVGSGWQNISNFTAWICLSNGVATAVWSNITATSSGDVTAAASFGTDNRLIASDGTGKGVKATGIGLIGSDTNTLSFPEAAATPATPATNRFGYYVLDIDGVQVPHTINEVGVATPLLSLVNPRYYWQALDDFQANRSGGNDGYTVGSGYNWVRVSANGGDIDYDNSTANHPGIMRLRTSANTNGFMMFHQFETAILPGDGRLHAEGTFRLGDADNTTEPFKVRFGFSNSTGIGDPSEGAYLRIDNLSSTAIFLVTRHSSTETTNSVAVAPSTSFQYWAVDVNKALNEVVLTVNTTKCTNTSNIFTSANPVGVFFSIHKFGGTAVVRELQVDRVWAYGFTPGRQ